MISVMVYEPASGPFVRNLGDVGMKSFLNIRPVVINLRISLGTWIIPWYFPQHLIPITNHLKQWTGSKPEETEVRGSYGVREVRDTHTPATRGTTTWLVTRGWIDVVLIDVTKLFLHRVRVKRFAFIRFRLSSKVASVHQLVIRPIRDHRMAPPIRHRSKVIIVIVSHGVSNLTKHTKKMQQFQTLRHDLV